MPVTFRSRTLMFMSVTFMLGAALIAIYVSRREGGLPIHEVPSPDPDKPAASAVTAPLPAKVLREEKHLRVGFSFSKPPYVTPAQFANVDPQSDGQQRLGFEVDIMQAALTAMGYTFKPSFQSFARIIADLDAGDLDAAETSDSPRANIYYSRPIICCQNFAISRKAAGLTIDRISDLGKIRCVAWQGAATDLGPSFTEMAASNPNYCENTNQQAQYRMFAEGKVDAIVIDKFIFQWWLAQDPKGSALGELVYHPLFPGVNPYHIGFRDKAVRDQFDDRFISLQESGDIDRIIARYIPGASPAIPASSTAFTTLYGIARPPFVMDQERRGISIDLADECFRRMGILVRPAFVSNQRMEAELAAGSVDIAIEVQQTSPSLYYSKPFITYQNVVASLSSEQLAIKAWSDLAGHQVKAWQTARTGLGDEFAAALPTFAKYDEYADQREQVLAWATGQSGVIIIDQTILKWNLASMARTIPNLPSLATIHVDPAPTGSTLEWCAGFRSEPLRTRFDQALEAVRQDGTYDRIFARYAPAAGSP